MLILSNEDEQFLLTAARISIESAVSGKSYQTNDLDAPDHVLIPGASFVTLTKNGALRGCIGTLKAYQPLLQDVCEHAVAAALEDYRFPPVNQTELDQITIEISFLTDPQPLVYGDADDLIRQLRPGMDGVTLKDNFRQATFLPQVWEQLPDPNEFLSHLCAKMGVRMDAWRNRHLAVEIYQVVHFSENNLKET